jgi:hypothetical protein
MLTLGDANHYGAPPLLGGPAAGDPLPPPAGFTARGRGLGVAEMALAIRENRAPRASGALMLHVLEVMEAVHRASREGPITIDSQPDRPDPFDAGTILSVPEG